ncbi:unnamed protein product [Dibothriocephalus latus]|uniref:AP complex mu/sigma subunit domain-containing protein n=1 Tax=Dibothriocephalus latus TaxID=60516 RepID=A0A3P7LFR0_DIBLA|nr:unnamed protein product [Dibothriocephalus latus]
MAFRKSPRFHWCIPMIWAVLIFNTNGKPRLMKFFEKTDETYEQEFLAETFRKLTRRSCDSCNFLEIKNNKKCSRLIYRQYATIYVVFCVDAAESELGILDLIQVFVDLLDKTFENVCELDIIFNSDKVNFLMFSEFELCGILTKQSFGTIVVHYLLNELICGGIVLETNVSEILKRIEEQEALNQLSFGRGGPVSDHQLALQSKPTSSLPAMVSSTSTRLRSHIRSSGRSVLSSSTAVASAAVATFTDAWKRTSLSSSGVFDTSGFHDINGTSKESRLTNSTEKSVDESRKLYL